MHMTLRQLEVFLTVASHLSYTRAAETLHLTQPAVSMQIRQLEETVGLALFEKSGRKIRLTEAGRELHHYSHNVRRELEAASEVLESLKGLSRGHLKIAVASTINYFAPRLLATFNRLHPNISLALNITNRENLVNALNNNEEDLVLMGQPPDDMDLTWEPFMENPLVVIASPEHSLASACRIPLTRLAQETFVMRELGSGTRIAIERLFEESGLDFNRGMEMTRSEAIKQAVRANMGVSILSLHTLELELETQRLKILDVQGFPLIRHWYLVYRHGKRLSPVAQAFRDFVIKHAAEI